MDQTLMEKDLFAFWGIAVAVFSFLLGTNVRQAVEQDLKNPNRIEGVSDLALLVALFAWFLLYLYSTYFEAKGMGLVFPPEVLDKLGTNVSFLVMALALAVFFALILAYHEKIIVVCIMAILLGVVDTFGNQTLMSGMLALSANSNSTEFVQKCSETIWYAYYINNPQLQRIFLYIAIAITALVLAIYREQLSNRVPPNLARNISKYLIIIAIIFNEATMLNWRTERENALEEVGRSYYFQWSPYNPISSSSKTVKTGNCPITL
ncbi:MAG: hypothetical protein ABW127_08505 [Candidatus Thiodiazotropha endolucinida]